MNFCCFCGNKLTSLKTPNAYEARYRCDNTSCNQRFHRIFGDGNGISSDELYLKGNRPFACETLDQATNVDDYDLGVI